jgi:predicted secreted protein
MANYRGMDGSVTFATNTVAELKGWSINTSIEILDPTVQGDKWRKAVGGLASWTGAAQGNVDYGDTNGQKAIVDKLIAATPASTAFASEFLIGTTKKITGNIVVTTIAIASQMGEIATIQFTFTGNGAPTMSWS